MHQIGGCVDYRAGGDIVIKIKISSPARNQTQDIQPVTTHFIEYSALALITKDTAQNSTV
jgi:hypothetical protein